MARAFTPKVVTANRLLEGDAVWLNAVGQWVTAMTDAHLFDDEDAANAALARGSAQSGVVVGVYLADAKSDANGPAPVHFREEFRTRGPSNYAHGKQADLT